MASPPLALIKMLKRKKPEEKVCNFQPDWTDEFAFVERAGSILEVLHCVLVESPEALNLIKEGHIKSIISLLDKHGRNYKVDSMRPNIFLGVSDGSAQYRKWYYELIVDQVLPFVTAEATHIRVGWASTDGYAPYPGGGEGWGCNGAGDDLYSYSFDGLHLWSDRIQSFTRKQDMWGRRLEQGNIDSFENMKSFIETNELQNSVLQCLPHLSPANKFQQPLS
ncbi:Ryanodine receptor 2 [Merluccius polli]|uniref:Ryanodine receptor 2 n=1 Tax=Merluccius polli TaxID=89951 RepID=A0AA47PAE4_MERPO|nr:Ryanodine receptor 2 [Merluccius polli]